MIATTGAGVNFVTISNNADSAPNAVFTPDPAQAGTADLISPPILVTSARSILNFRQKYALETTWDGAVLEIKIGDGDFQDVLNAGCTFLAGGYNRILNPSANPLSNRFTWTGGTGDYISTSVQLPANAFGKTIQFRWRLGSNESFGNDGWWIDTITFETISAGVNSNPINIPISGTATQYPSDIQISNLPGLVTGVSVNLENFSHASPDDVDILLVAPNGRRIILMSDVGGNAAVSNLTLTFSDSAAINLPDNSPLSSGIFKPTNYDEADIFPAPAPQGAPAGTNFGAFYGTNPNGVWSLYVVDDNGDNAGVISGGWNLELQSSVNACLFNLSPSSLGFSSFGGSGVFQINIPAGCGWTVSTINPFITIDSPTNGVGNGAVNISVAANTGAARTGLVSITDGFNIRNFQVQQNSGCPTSLNQTNLNFSASGGNGSVAVTAGAGCSWQAISNAGWIEITSSPQTGNGFLSFNVLPNSARSSRNALITIGARSLNVTQAGFSTTNFDFDGDGKSDVSVFRLSNNTWYRLNSAAGNSFFSAQFGAIGDLLAPADFDGDGKIDLAVFRPSNGVWYISQSSNNAVISKQFGQAGDLPRPADFDGDGRADLSVFRPSNGFWYRVNSSNNQFVGVQFGLSGDVPQPGDFDGDGRADLNVFRPSNGTWYQLNFISGQSSVIQFGLSNDVPTSADFDGDGKIDLAVFRPSNGVWYRLNSQNGQFVEAQWGASGDAPVAADYDGDGKADLAVFRNGIWYLQQSTAGFSAVQFGLSADKLIPAAFIQP